MVIPNKHGDLSHSSSQKGLSLTNHCPSSPLWLPQHHGGGGVRGARAPGWTSPSTGTCQFHSHFFGWTWSHHPSLATRGEHHPGDSGTWFQDIQLGLGLKGEREALHAFQGSCNPTASRQ